MKKSFVLLITLVVLAAAVLCVGQQQILAEKDQVTIIETILFGDKAVADGVNVNLHNHYESQIFWDTTYVIGEEPKTDTAYAFHQYRQSMWPNIWYGNIYFNSDVHFIGWDAEGIVVPEGLEVAVQELMNSIGASESGSKTIRLKDYMDYYNFSISFQTPYKHGDNENRFHYELSSRDLKAELNRVENNNAYSKESVERLRKEWMWLESFQNFFRIPVLENEVYMISMKKDEYGEVIGYGMSNTNGGMGSGDIDIPEFTDVENYDSFGFNTCYFVGDGDVYLTFNTYSDNGNIVDTSQIPGGYGIYHFPYDLEKEEIYPEQLEMVYALDPNLDVIDLSRDARGENLLLFTSEDPELYMSVIDIETMTLVDKFSISEPEKDIYGENLYGLDYYVSEEDYMVVLTDGEVVVFSIDENGTYTKEFEVSREPLREFFSEEDRYYYDILQYDTVYDWNGKELLFANNMYNVNGYMGTNFYVGVMDASGLQYFATYETSLQSTISRDENGYENYNYPHVRPVDANPIEVHWK